LPESVHVTVFGMVHGELDEDVILRANDV